MPEENVIAQYDVSAEAIESIRRACLPLRVEGPDDVRGFGECKKAREDVRALRVKVEKRRKELKADALEYGRAVDAAARSLTIRLAPIEDHLKGEIERAEEEARERDRQRDREAAERLDERVRDLQRYRADYSVAAVAAMADAEFAEFILPFRAEFERGEAARQAEVEAQAVRDAEVEALRAEAARLREEIARQRPPEPAPDPDEARLEYEAEEDRRLAEEFRRYREGDPVRIAAEASNRPEAASPAPGMINPPAEAPGRQDGAPEAPECDHEWGSYLDFEGLLKCSSCGAEAVVCPACSGSGVVAEGKP